MAGFLDIVTPTTIANYAKGAEDGVTVNTPSFKYLKEKGEWNYDVGGSTMEGVLEAGFERPIISAPGMDLTLALKSINRYARYATPWGEIAGVKVVDIGALRRNQNPKQALVKFRDKEVPAMLKGMYTRVDGFLHQFWNQNIASPTQTSNAISGTTVTGLPLGGLASFLYAPGATLNGSDGALTPVLTGTGVAAGDKEAVPVAQTYLGLSTAPSGITGVDNVQPDAWQPTLVNTKSSAWDGTGGHMSQAIQFWLQWMVARAMRFSGGDANLNPDPMSSGWLSFDYFQFLGAFIASKQTVYLTGQSGPTPTNAAMGVNTNHLDHAGMRWQWDERMPTKSAFVIPWQHVRVDVQPLFPGIEGNGNPLGKDGEDAGMIETAITWDPIRRQWIVTGTMPCQFLCNPRYFVRGGEYA